MLEVVSVISGALIVVRRAGVVGNGGRFKSENDH